MGRRRGKVNKKGRNAGDGQYMGLPYSMTQHQAWRSLSGNAVKVFIELRSRFNGGNNGKLILSYEEAAKLLGMSKTSVGRAYDDLQRKGFIKLEKKGHWYGRKASEWRCTDCACDGNIPTKDWTKSRPEKTEAGIETEHIHGPTGPPRY